MTVSVLQHAIEPTGPMDPLRYELASATAAASLPSYMPRRRFRDRVRPRIERRRSDRVHPGRTLQSELEHAGTSRILCLSLGGVTLEGPTRLEPGVGDQLMVTYRDLSAEIGIVTYRSSVKELFYAANGLSWICYRSHAVFHEPSVDALNLVYRIIADHWIAPDDDDTRPHRA